MKRRSFLKHTSHGLLVPGLLGSFGFSFRQVYQLEKLMQSAEENDRILVLIFMEGGNDGLNTLVPLEYISELNSLRSHVILPDSAILQLPGTSFGFHPALEGLKSMFLEGKLKIINSVGYPDQNYSHFRSTDIWLSASDADEYINSGWMGRHLANDHPEYPEAYPNSENPHPLAIEIGWGASMLFQGASANMGMVINSTDAFYEMVNNEEEYAPDTPAGDRLRYVRLIARQSQEYGKAVTEIAQQGRNIGTYPQNNDLAEKLKIVARLINGGLQTKLFLVQQGSYDTHSNQVESEDHTLGEHANLLRELNDAIQAFQADIEAMHIEDRVMGMTFSEFGRTILSNASNGTDHGAAAPLFLFGSQVAGGILGTAPELDSHMEYWEDIPMQYDFRQVYSSVLDQWLMNRSPEAILNKEFEQVTIIGEPAIPLSLENENPAFQIFPNPVNGKTVIRILGSGENIKLNLLDVSGKYLKNIYQGATQNGINEIPWDASTLPRGNYLVRAEGTVPSTVRIVR